MGKERINKPPQDGVWSKANGEIANSGLANSEIGVAVLLWRSDSSREYCRTALSLEKRKTMSVGKLFDCI